MEHSLISGARPRTNQKRSLELKRYIVEQTLRPGASVARIAREHGINANQVFAWRKLHREGLLGEGMQAGADLVAVTMEGEPGRAALTMPPAESPSLSVLRVESAKGCLTLEGRPDPTTLRIVLDRLLR
jgi:transposase